MAQCLVTGGAGFIGSHLVEALLAQGHAVRVLDNLSTGTRANLAKVQDQIEFLLGDLGDRELVREAAQDVELLFHLAALPSVHQSVEDPLTAHLVCATGTLHVLLAARAAGVQRVIYGGSASVYGESAVPCVESAPLQPQAPCAVAKLAGEHYCASFSVLYGVETVRLRYFNVFGPRQAGGSQYAAVIPQMLETMLAGRRPVVHGDGLQARDFTYIDDVIQANLLAAEAPRVYGRVYNIGSSRKTTILELVERINHILGTDLRPIHSPPRSGDIRHSQADISRAQADLGFCPCTDLDQGLRRCLDYLSSRRKGPKGIRKQVFQPN
jgi:UDP-glucose 4-epimerase